MGERVRVRERGQKGVVKEEENISRERERGTAGSSSERHYIERRATDGGLKTIIDN